MMESYRDDRSSTAKESDAESISLEKEGLLGETETRASKSRRMWANSRWYPLLAAIMAIANVILGSLLFVQYRTGHENTTASPAMPHTHHHDHKPKQSTPVPIGGLPHVDSHPDWLPPEEWRTEVFRLHQIYGEEPVGTAKEAWLSLIPSKQAYN